MATDINICGTPETIQQRNDKLVEDLAIYATRPFLFKQEKLDMQEYYNMWAKNRFISLMNYDESGNYLGKAYSAPKDIIEMLYPLADLIGYDRRGTIIIDREQYSPELRNLSYFIYIVDPELFDEYKKALNFNGETLVTYMFDREANDGVRVFKSYFDLARHLRTQRSITFILGPRTTFYMRYYLHEMHEHTIANGVMDNYRESGSLAKSVYSHIQRHGAFRLQRSLSHTVDLTKDAFSKFRSLEAHFKINLPSVEKKELTTMITRYSKQTMHSKVLCKIKKNRIGKYEELGVQPWHHIMIHGDKAILFVWDTRNIEDIIDASLLDQDDISYNVTDSRLDIKVKSDAPVRVKTYLEANKFDIPVQFRYEELTADEAFVDDPLHY